jgi:hypothetical protein
MKLDTDHAKSTINALARTYNAMLALPELIKQVKAHIRSPDWALSKAVFEVQEQLIDADKDLTVIEALHTAMLQRASNHE